MSEALLLFVSLPLAVYTLAGFYALIDFTDKAKALLHLTLRVAFNVLLLLVFGAANWPWLLTAYGIVITAHLGMFAFVRIAVLSGRWISRRID